MSKRKVETLLGIPLFSWASCEHVDENDVYFEGVVWNFESMRKFNGRFVRLHRANDTNGLITLANRECTADEPDWAAVSLLKISEFREAIFRAAAAAHI